MVKYLHRIQILKLEERFRTIAGPRGEDGKATIQSESLGWWALLDTDPKIWIYLGAFKPDNTFTITLEAKWSPT